MTCSSIRLPRGGAAAIVGSALLVACSGTSLRLATGRGVPSSSDPPQIKGVRDIGSPVLAGKQRIPRSANDGVAVIGELLLVHGDGFGRQPRVVVDNRPTRTLARTTDGGIVVRVPWGVRSGKRLVKVRNSHGDSKRSFSFRRYALATVPSKDAIHPLEVAPARIRRLGKPLRVPSAHLVRYCAGGHIAYVSGRDGKGLLVATIDMVARGGPRIVGKRRVPGELLVALASAERAPLAVALTDTHVVFLDTRDPARPAPYKPQPLPAELAGKLVAADMEPTGQLLALLLRRNELRLFDVSRPGLLQPLARNKVLPGVSAPLVRDVRFAADSRTLWVISGDNIESVRKGRFPLRLTVIKIQNQQHGRAKSFGVLSVWKTLDVPHRAAPVDLAVARGQPLATGQTVRVPPKNAAVFITAHDSKLLRLRRTRFDRARGLRRAVRILRGIRPLGTVVRTNINGEGGPMFTSPSLLGAIDITSDSQLLLVAGAQVEFRRRPTAMRLVYGVSSRPVFRNAKPVFVPLGEVDPETLPRAFMLGDVRIQP